MPYPSPGMDNSPDNSRYSATWKEAALNRLAAEIGFTFDLGQILERGLKIIRDETGAEVAEIFLVEGAPDAPPEQIILRQAVLLAPPETREAFTGRSAIEYEAELPGLVAPTVVDESVKYNPFLTPLVKESGFQAGLVIPLRAHDQLLGMLGLFSRDLAWKPDQKTGEIGCIEDIVAKLALATDNALSYSRLEQARTGMTALSNAVEILNSSLNPRHVLVRLLSEAVRLMGANGGAVYLYQAGASALQPEATILIDPDWRERPLLLSNSLAAEVILTGAIRTVSDTSTTPERVYPLLEEVGRPGSVVAAPLLRRGQLRGVLECYSASPRNFSKHELELLAAFASHAVVALRNAELHHELMNERRQVEVERKKLQAILDNSPEGFFFAQKDGTIVDFNQSARDILGLGNNTPENFFRFDRPYQVYQPDGVNRLEEEIAMGQALKEERTVVAQEAILRWPDGKEKHLLLSAAPIYDEQNRMMGAFSVFQDVTRLKEAEKLKSKFLSMITHELKTPLASIKGTISGLLQEDVEWDEATQKRFLHSIDDDVDGMVALVANLLDMARLEAGFMRPDLEECYLVEVAEEAARKLRGLARNARQKIEFDFDPAAPPVAADFTHIERVLVNLIGNALKYSPNDTTVTVSIRTVSGKDGRTEVETAIADRGPGIPATDREQIFKQFYRGQHVAGRTGRKVGTGLGLAICREIITLHGGRIWVEDREGGGSVFKFSLPAIDG